MSRTLFSTSLVVWSLATLAAFGNGVLRDGYSTDSIAMGGTGVAFARDPLTSLGVNPATLSLLDAPMFSFSLTGAHGEGDFDNALNRHTNLGRDFGVFPEFAVSMPVRDSPFTVAFGLKVDSARLADWRYLDTPGGVDGATSYGRRTHRSEFLAVSATVGVGWEVTEKLSLGASVGLIYHRIGLDLPFIFQSEPTLVGWKTLLDLETDGFGWNAILGMHYQFTDNVAFGLSYTAKADLHSSGKARGHVGAQLDSLELAGVEPRFRYDADLDTALPQVISAGVSWQFHERFRLAAQVDWINWSDAYDTLEVGLDDGSNAAVNGLTGGNSLHDTVPVDWHDRLVYRAGLEASLNESTQVLLGYSYGRSPLPTTLTTPLNGALFEHTLTAGVRTTQGPWSLGVAYQYHLPNAESVEQSGYRSGEYANSRLEMSAHMLTLQANVTF